MKVLINIIILCVLGLTSLNAQSLSKEYIDDWIVKTFPTSKVDSNAVYILNRHLIDTDSINIKLEAYAQSDLMLIDFLDKSTIDRMVICTPLKGIVLLTTKGNQNKNLIRKNFTQVKRQFAKREFKIMSAEPSKVGQPVLIINGKQIESSKGLSEIKELKESDIYGINIIERPVSQTLYGENGKNGLIIIITQ